VRLLNVSAEALVAIGVDLAVAKRTTIADLMANSACARDVLGLRVRLSIYRFSICMYVCIYLFLFYIYIYRCSWLALRARATSSACGCAYLSIDLVYLYIYVCIYLSIYLSLSYIYIYNVAGQPCVRARRPRPTSTL